MDLFTTGRPASLVIRFHRAICGRWLALAGADCQQGRILPGPDKGEFENMAFHPLGDRVAVRRVEEEAKSKGGIIIPDTVKEKPIEGEILAVGTGTRDEQGKVHALDVKVGDRVLFGKWSGTEVKIDGEDLMVMKESDIMGVVG